jgi:hypothetical protein
MTGPRSTSSRAATNTDQIAGKQVGGGLFDGFEAYQTPTEADYRRLLTDGIVVPDANVFLDLYRYNEQTRNDLFSVLRVLGDRLWVPHQVVVEFWRNREAVLQDPRDISITIRELTSQRDKAINIFRSWANRVNLREQRTAELIDVLTHAFTTVTGGVSELSDDDAVDFARNTNRDPVLLELEPIMRGRVGAALNKDEYREAVAEAKRRADSKIPPGYKDSGKDLIASAGDYLVWLQTIHQAKLLKRDVLFVTGDVKEDWWRREHGELRGPQPELVEEMKEHSSVRLFMLRPESLLLQARQALQIDVSDESVQDLERVDQSSASFTHNIPTDVEDIRARWTDILEAVMQRRRIAWMLLSSAKASDFDVETLTVEFKRDGDAKGFQSSGCYIALREALGEVFGIYPKILAVSSTGAIFEESPKSGTNADREPKSNNIMILVPGDRVVHDAYGLGVVLAVEGSPDDPEAKIDFGGGIGVKHLVLRYAPISNL